MRTFNIIETYVDKDDSWSGILASASFAISSTKNMQKGYSLVQLIFGCDVIILIKHRADWELLRQRD